jgi:hypothetical protein
MAAFLSCSFYGGAYRWSRTNPHPPAAQVCAETVAILMPPSEEAASARLQK